MIEGIIEALETGVSYHRQRIKSLNVTLKRLKLRRTIHLKIKNNQPIGRPRSLDYPLILELRNAGFSMRLIALQIGRSKGAVQHAIKRMKEKKKL